MKREVIPGANPLVDKYYFKDEKPVLINLNHYFNGFYTKEEDDFIIDNLLYSSKKIAQLFHVRFPEKRPTKSIFYRASRLREKYDLKGGPKGGMSNLIKYEKQFGSTNGKYDDILKKYKG